MTFNQASGPEAKNLTRTFHSRGISSGCVLILHCHLVGHFLGLCYHCCIDTLTIPLQGNFFWLCFYSVLPTLKEFLLAMFSSCIVNSLLSQSALSPSLFRFREFLWVCVLILHCHPHPSISISKIITLAILFPKRLFRLLSHPEVSPLCYFSR